MKLLLHACCGPCSLEPVRLLHEAGHHLTIYFANVNIAPFEEYMRRRDTLEAWAAAHDIAVVEGTYEPSTWNNTAGRAGQAALDKIDGNVERCALEPSCREARCRACYRLRFEETAHFAAHHNFEGIGTTLSVSPYQFTEVIREELKRAARLAGVQAHFEDYRPFYDEATRRSRSEDMYRQNYCGCAFSEAEAAAEREMHKRERAALRAAKEEARAEARRAAEEAREALRTEKQAYAEKQARKHTILKALREQNKS